MRFTLVSLCLLGAMAASPAAVRGQAMARAAATEALGVDEHLEQQLPLEAAFTDQTGRRIVLREAMDGDRPAVLVFNYHRCAVLCDLVLSSTVGALRELDWTIGEDYDLISISIDPTDTPASSREKLHQARAMYGRATPDGGWHFLTSPGETPIARVTDAAGFRYTYDEDQGQYRHPAVLMILTPDGRLARYLYGLDVASDDLRLGLLEAAEGRAVGTLEQVLVYCYRYDPAGGRYVVVAENVMKLFAGVVAVALGSFLVILWRRERRRARAASRDESASR